MKKSSKFAPRPIASYPLTDAKCPRRKSTNCKNNTSTSVFWKNIISRASASFTCDDPFFRCPHSRWRRGWADVRHRSRQARTPRRCTRTRQPTGKENSRSPAVGAATSLTSTASRKTFSPSNPHFAKSALARYTPTDFIALVEKHAHPLSRKNSRPTFLRPLRPRHSRHARSRMPRSWSQHISQYEDSSGRTHILNSSSYTADAEFHAPALWSSRPEGSRFPKSVRPHSDTTSLANSSIVIREPWPALVPLLFNAEDASDYCDLAGVSTEVIAILRRPAVPRKNADHAPRPQRPCDPSDFLLLEKSATHSDRSRSWQRNYRRFSLIPICQEIQPLSARNCASFFRIASPTAGCNSTCPLPGLIPYSPISKITSITGRSLPPEPKATRKPKSLPAASIPANSPPKRWRAAKFPACSSSAK